MIMEKMTKQQESMSKELRKNLKLIDKLNKDQKAQAKK